MDARVHPRTTLSLPVGLFCAAKDRYYQRTTRDISVGGLFVSGAPCARNGTPLDIIVKSDLQSQTETQQYQGEVVRNAASGFALRFTHLDDGKTRTLEEMIWPEWDGENVFEGLLIIGAREHADDLAGWLRLTSLLSNQYRRHCRNHKFVVGSR